MKLPPLKRNGNLLREKDQPPFLFMLDGDGNRHADPVLASYLELSKLRLSASVC